MIARKCAALVFSLIACQSRKLPDDAPPSHVVPLVSEDVAVVVVADTGVRPAMCTKDEQAEPTELGKAPCNLNEDCVLTDVPQQCSACNTKSLYPALKKNVDARRCASGCVPQRCPPHDTYSPAFYRAECRAGRCVAFRWHSGG